VQSVRNKGRRRFRRKHLLIVGRPLKGSCAESVTKAIKGHLKDTLREMQEDLQSSISYAGGSKLMDIRRVNYVILGGANDGEHLLM
jgi:IMP dehydrogenase/GMP reductase